MRILIKHCLSIRLKITISHLPIIDLEATKNKLYDACQKDDTTYSRREREVLNDRYTQVRVCKKFSYLYTCPMYVRIKVLSRLWTLPLY